MVLHGVKANKDDGRTPAERFLQRLRSRKEHLLKALRWKRSREMGLSHKDVTAMIPRYLSDDLSDRELIAFLKHINSCRECYEELETMFMVDRTIHYLDDGQDGSFDLTPELIRDMERKLHRVRHAGRRGESRARLLCRSRLCRKPCQGLLDALSLRMRGLPRAG